MPTESDRTEPNFAEQFNMQRDPNRKPWEAFTVTEAIRRIVPQLPDWLVGNKELEVIFGAARRVANLHESIDPKRLNDGLKFAHITDSDAEYLVYVAQQVSAALGITEDE